MEYIPSEEVRVVSPSPSCSVWEYDISDKDLNIAVAKISGRYPIDGWSTNEKCKMMGFVLQGTGSLVTENKTLSLKENDLVLLLPGEKYYWEGNMTVLVPATPAWYVEQYKFIPN